MKNHINKHTYSNGILYTFRNNSKIYFKYKIVEIPQYVCIFYSYENKDIQITIRRLIKKGYKKFCPDYKILKTYEHHYFIECYSRISFDTLNHIVTILNDINVNGFKD